MAKEVQIDVTDKIIDGGSYFAVIEPVFYSVSIYDGPEQYEQDLAKYSKEQRYVLACHWYLSEVFNGGHDQFYDNSTGIVWKDAREGFLAIGAREISEIINESVSRLGGNPSAFREERQKQLERSRAEFGDLDEKLYQTERKIELSKKLLEYIKSHRDRFYFSGTVNK